MEQKSSFRLLSLAALLLLALNLILLGYLWRGRDGAPPRPDWKHAAGVLRDRLQLTPDQEATLKNIRADFFAKESDLSRLIRSQRDSMNDAMFGAGADTAAVVAIARRVADNEYRMELYRIEQAAQVRALCNETQLRQLRELVTDLRDYLKPEPPKR